MPVDMIVCVKQVLDPEMPASAFQVDAASKRVKETPGIPPVINGFDENAVEAALRIKEEVGGSITILSVGREFVMEVLKKPLSMGADNLVLAQDDSFGELDAYTTALVLAEAIRKIERFDLVLCGRQASDWDNAHVPLGVAEMLGLPCMTTAQRVEVADGGVVVERALEDGYEVLEAGLPAVVTASNQLGEPRYPTLRGIMAAGRKAPTVWTASDLGLGSSDLSPRVRVADLFIPANDQACEIIQGEDEADSGRLLALRLHEVGLI